MRKFKGSNSLTLAGVGAVAAGTVALVASCGGGGSDSTPVETAATIDSAGVATAIADFEGIVGICRDDTTGAMRAGRKLTAAVLLQKGIKLTTGALPPMTKTRLALSSTPPPDQLGDCGGRWGYRNYSHLNGVTTATLAFENYCMTDTDTGEQDKINGKIAFVNTATPTASGPITTQLVADTSEPVTLVVQDTGGAQLSSQTLSFSGFKMVVGEPGGTPTAAKPDVMSMTDMTVKSNDTGKTYRQSNYTLRQYETPAGNVERTMTGRGYRSNGSYYDIATTQPMVEDADGDVVSGVITFTGANGTKAVATLVPGPTMQATLTVNGVPVTSVPACVR
jgi:hypothetical protein